MITVSKAPLFMGVATAATLLLSTCTFVFADDAVPSPTPRPRQLIQQQFKKSLQTEKETIRTDRAKFHATRLQRNFSFYALRLNNVATRIQSLINKRKASGKDVTAAQTQLDTSKATLQQAIADGQKAVDMFNAITVDVWNIQKPEVKAAITQAQLARKEFVTARTQMVQTVKLLRQ